MNWDPPIKKEPYLYDMTPFCLKTIYNITIMCYIYNITRGPQMTSGTLYLVINKLL